MGYSFKQSFPLDWTAPPVDTLFLLSFSYLCKYNKTWKKSQNTGVQKKECAGLDRLNPLKSFFLSVPNGIFPRYRFRSCPVSPVFSVHHGQKRSTFTKTLQQPPFPWLLPQALGDSVKTGQREPMGLWVALSASAWDTVHTYGLRKTASNNKLKSPYGSWAEGDLEGDGMVHKVNINPIQSLSINEPWKLNNNGIYNCAISCNLI